MKTILVLLFFSYSIIFSQEIIIYTETFPPYNYVENGKITGVSTEILKEVLKQAGIKYKITVYPWARAYYTALHKKNSMIYSIIKNEKRKKEFIFCGSLIKTQTAFIKLKSRKDIVIKKFDDFKKYKIGYLNRSAGEYYLKKHCFANIYPTFNPGVNILELYFKRVDFIIFDINTFYFWITKKYNTTYKMNPSDFEFVYIIPELSTDLEFAFNKDTKPEIIKKCKIALKKIKKSEKYQKILKKYFSYNKKNIKK